MTIDAQTLERVRTALAGRQDVVERRMMGAVCFMVGGAMCCGVSGPTLMVRVGREAHGRALTEPHVRPMEVGGRRPAGFVRVDPEGFATEAALLAWVARGLATVAGLGEGGARAAPRRKRLDGPKPP